MKRIIFIIFIIFVAIFCEGQEIINKQFLTKIDIGSEKGQIGFAEVMLSMGGRPAPVCFTITESNLVYIPDVANKRINVYDLNFNIVNTIILEKYSKMHYSSYLKINEDEKYIVGAGAWGIERIYFEGKKQFYFKNNKISKKITNGDFYIFNDIVAYYNEDGSVGSILSDGSIVDSLTTNNYLKQINMRSNNTQKKYLDIYSKDVLDKIELFKKNKDIIMIEDILYTVDLKKYSKYVNSIFNSTKQKKKEYFNYTIFNGDFNWWKIIGYDDNFNKYIFSMKKNTNEKYMNIFKRNGEKLRSFSFDDLKNNSLKNGNKVWPSVAPNGDVYFMRSDESGTSFWKVERQW